MKKYETYKAHLQQLADIRYAAALLQWDQETYIPKKGTLHRSRQLATLAGIAHELATDPKLGDLLEALSKDSSLSEREKVNIKESLRDYKKQQKYTKAFVEEQSRCISQSFHAWQQAREENNFSIFAPHLEQLVKLKREEAEMVGYEDHPYDALLDHYEPGCKTADLTVLFQDVKQQLVDFVKTISEQPQNNDAVMFKHYAHQQQWDFGIELLQQMHYDFDAGRQDLSAHPFTTSFGPKDVRVTTRVNENDLNEMIWSTIHEGGHALYEQGLTTEDYGLPTGEAISLSIHESQSRLWENNVGRGRAYWESNYKTLQQLFPQNLGEVDLAAFYKAMNIVKPSLIRTNADELTYHFHVLIRFEIEKALMEGTIEVKDLPSYWNARYKEYLNIEVPTDTQGVLQDIHWSHGSFGYFPTYSLGSFYAAQFYAQALIEIPALEAEIRAGNMLPLLQWLRENIHQHGKLYTSEELCQKITGEKLNFKYFMDYARKKYTALYNLQTVAV